LSITQPAIVQFHSNLLQTMRTNTRCTKRFLGQEIKGEGHNVTAWHKVSTSKNCWCLPIG